MTALIATSTAVVVVVIALLLSQLFRAAVARGSATTETSSEIAATLVARDVDTGRSTDMKFRQSKLDPGEPQAAEEAQAEAPREGSDDGGSPAYRHVGDEVTAVLTAAEQAAAQIRETALKDAERTRLDADERAAATLAESEARRLEADSYSEETRAAADAYAEETQRKANEQAARRVSQAEEQARRIQVEAEEMGRNLEAEARRRGDALTKSAEGVEARIESALTVFRGMVSELEELLPTERRTRADVPPAADPLDNALNPAARGG